MTLCYLRCVRQLAWLLSLGLCLAIGSSSSGPWLHAGVSAENGDASSAPRIVSVRKIWDAGNHNAFTDLIRWRDRWFCTFREADDHVGGDGQIRVLASADGHEWESWALVSEEGIDLRDPKISVTPDDRLMIVCGGSVYGGTTTLKSRQPRVTFSADGRTWSPPERVLWEHEWLWRVTWQEGTCYGVTYNADGRRRPGSEKDPDWALKLVKSDDGRQFEVVTPLRVHGWPNETTLRFLPSGDLLALVRREGANRRAWIGRSSPPYTDWKWHETDRRVGGPNFIQLPDGQLVAAVRKYEQGAKTILARMTEESLTPVLEFPSGGDTSYAGLVWHDGLLWMSYYSSHEGKTSIYLAQIEWPLNQ